MGDEALVLSLPLTFEGVQIVARPQIGAIPVHIYYINETNSAWSHADSQGSFFVLTPHSATNITVTAVVPVSTSCYHGCFGFDLSSAMLQVLFLVLLALSCLHCNFGCVSSAKLQVRA